MNCVFYSFCKWYGKELYNYAYYIIIRNVSLTLELLHPDLEEDRLKVWQCAKNVATTQLFVMQKDYVVTFVSLITIKITLSNFFDKLQFQLYGRNSQIPIPWSRRRWKLNTIIYLQNKLRTVVKMCEIKFNSNLSQCRYIFNCMLSFNIFILQLFKHQVQFVFSVQMLQNQMIVI